MALSCYVFAARILVVDTCILMLLVGCTHAAEPTANTNKAGSEVDTIAYKYIAEESVLMYYEHGVNITWPVYKAATIEQGEGDVILGGLFMAHERHEVYVCGSILEQPGIQALEAMLYTVDRINMNDTFLPGFRLGVHALDDCDKDTYGLEQSVDFIRGSISNIGGTEITCRDNSIPVVNYKQITGVVGAASSINSIQTANLLKLFKIPQISYWSTSPDLSNRERFEYFSRTVPSDFYQAGAMIEIILHFNWTYISIVHEDSNYGVQGISAFTELAREYGICIALTEKFPKDQGQGNEDTYDKIVKNLLEKQSARVVIVYGSEQDAAGLMGAAKKMKGPGHFVWVGSDGWSNRQLPAEQGKESILEGAITVQPLAEPIQGFDDYFLGLDPNDNERNPWFQEFWETHFKCMLPNSTITPNNVGFRGKECTGDEKLQKGKDYEQDGQLQFVADAVLAFAYALKDMHADKCGGLGLCKKMQPIKGNELLEYLRKVSFSGITGDTFEFMKGGDGPARYKIMNYQQKQPGKYGYVDAGQYADHTLELDLSVLQYRLEEPDYPQSICSLPCGPGEKMSMIEGEKCCWVCVPCGKYAYLEDDLTCAECPDGTLPNETLTGCFEIEAVHMEYSSVWAISSIAFATIGIMLTTATVVLFIRYNDTPVVKASGRELSYVLLLGVFLCFCMTFLMITKPNDIICGAQKFMIGIAFATCYAALMIKTNRIARIFNSGKTSAKRPSYISPQSQLVFTAVLVSIQVVISSAFIVASPPKAIRHYPTRDEAQLVCRATVDTSYMLGLAYPIFLMVLCTLYAIKTRKIPEAFNEAKFIGFTMYTTCIIWLAFIPIYLTTANNIQVRITTTSFAISLSGFVVLACLFSPKVYIVVFRPERNKPQSKMLTNKRKTPQARPSSSCNTSSGATCTESKSML
uniref:Metabotropic glutamate receptor 8-like n=1 Tax=Saccoglossus kowalevskii TaxID=10224 RepID=A0ABM0MJF8_SACKO|nr:PREDICTED: metabotropic glutamate receptor 8-like [Saccoglossus kowalevskii]